MLSCDSTNIMQNVFWLHSCYGLDRSFWLFVFHLSVRLSGFSVRLQGS